MRSSMASFGRRLKSSLLISRIFNDVVSVLVIM
jgi:hypothetical protein